MRMMHGRSGAGPLVGGMALLICIVAYGMPDPEHPPTVETYQDCATGETVVRVTVDPDGDPIRDFHLRCAKKIRLGDVGDPIREVTQQVPGGTQTTRTTMTGWQSPSANSSGQTITWRTADTEVGGEGDENPTDEPIGPGETVEFRIPPGGTSNGFAEGRYYVTTDGKTTCPSGTECGVGTVATGTLDLPVKLTYCEPQDPTPAPGSGQLLAVTEGTPGLPFQFYLAASLSVEGDPATDPLGIGINTMAPVPPAWGVVVTPATGMFDPEGEVSCQLTVGPGAPLGMTFYLVVAETPVGPEEPEAWSDPVEFTIAIE